MTKKQYSWMKHLKYAGFLFFLIGGAGSVGLHAQESGAATPAVPRVTKERVDSDAFKYFREQQQKTGGEDTLSPQEEAVLPVLGRLDVSGLGKVLIHDDGRVKPLDSYARTHLLIFNGRSTFKDETGKKYQAIDWLAHVMFEPEKALDDLIFKLTFPDVLHALGISPREGKRYSFTDLLPGVSDLRRLASFAFQKKPAERTAWDKEIMRLYANYTLYYEISTSFFFALPTRTFFISDAEVKVALGLDPKQATFSYLQMMERADTLFALSETINSKEESGLRASEFIIREMIQRYESFPQSFSELPFNLFPSYSHGEERWFSPWKVFLVNSGGNLVNNEMGALKEIVEAYRGVNAGAFMEAVGAYRGYINEKLDGYPVIRRASWELMYHKLDPFYRSSLLYGMAFLGMLGFFAFPRSRRRLRLVKVGATGFLIMALALTLAGIIMRMVITMRPPITNLFSTFTFVGFVTALGGLLLEKYEKRGIGILTGALSGVILLLISNYFAADGDTLHVLVAVLRSNFWLTTHVIAINLGYGGMILSGVIAHVYLIKLTFYERGRLQTKRRESDANASKNDGQNTIKEKKQRLKSVFKLIYAVQAFGLLFTVLGTILGGIWADQSWGRFWGWDPKENGSLLIVLWSTLLFHARFAGMIREMGFAAGAIAGIIVVMFAWFGINLLGVGLHSYGFTEGIAFPLFLYIVLQGTVIFFLMYFIKSFQQLQTMVKIN